MTPSETLVSGEVLANRPVAPDHFEMTVRLPETFADPVPGQFVMIRSAGHLEPLLARPLSVYRFTRRPGEADLHLLYRVAGRGTDLFSRLTVGSPVSLLGPLGRGFTWMPDRQPLLVAGGVGVAPLVHLLERFAAQDGAASRRPVCYLGAKSGALLLARDRLAGLCDLRVCTDDGSEGRPGLVTERLAEEIGAFAPDRTCLYVCGPGPMVRSLAALLEGRAYPCQVSLEERMACGFGACLGCAVAVRNGEGKAVYQRVCKEGPVFPLAAIVPRGMAEEGGCL